MKNMKKISLVLALIIISGLLSCGTDDNPIISPIEFTIDDFPTEIGTVWQYQYVHHDLASVVTDTVYVRIDGTTQIGDDSLFVYMVISANYSLPQNYTDTTYWHISGDTVTYYKNIFDSLTITQKLIFPLEVGSLWTTDTTMIDTNEVTDKSTRTVFDKSYANSYQITKHSSNCTECYNYYSFVPNIGLIHSSEEDPYINAPNSVWNLISFNTPDKFELSDFPLQVNASWTYNVYNNLIDCPNCYDTVTVTIIDSVDNQLDTISENWQFEFVGNDTIRLNRLIQDSLILQWIFPHLLFTLEFPFSVGKQWLDEYGPIKSYINVIGIETITTDAEMLVNAYHLRGKTGLLEPFTTFDIWISKGIGIIKIQFTSIRNSISETWILQSYDPDKPNEPFSIDKFPNHDKMTRGYQRFNYSTQAYDTILVNVAESSTVSYWNYSCPDSSWQEIVSKEGSVAKFFYPDDMIEPFKSYQFPLELNSSWITYPIGSSSEITSLSIITLPFGRFHPCYAIETRYLCDGECISREKEWVYSNIGILHKFIYTPDDGITEIWRLIDYSNP